jgi:transposase InsO family protein
LIRDRDCVYGAAVTRRLRAMGIRDKPIASGSPWQNGFAERLIGSIRRECVALGRKLGVPNGVLDVLVPEVVLQAARIDAPVGQL